MEELLSFTATTPAEPLQTRWIKDEIEPDGIKSIKRRRMTRPEVKSLSEGQAAGPLCNLAAPWTVTAGRICEAKVEKLPGPQYP